MPLVHHLKEGFKGGKPVGWHRNEERRARGMFPVKGLSVQLEPWERQLVSGICCSVGACEMFRRLAYSNRDRQL